MFWLITCLSHIRNFVIRQLPNLLCCAAFLFVLRCSTASASLIYLYDFPGDTGSGLARKQVLILPVKKEPIDALLSGMIQSRAGNIRSGVHRGKISACRYPRSIACIYNRYT